jgi:integrase
MRKKGAVYRVKVHCSGALVGTKSFSRRVDAERYEAKLRLTPQSLVSNKIRFEEFTKVFLELCATPNLEVSSVKRYESAIRNYYNPYFGELYLSDISKQILLEFKAKIMNQAFSGSQKYFIICSLKTIFRRAVELDYLDRNPAVILTAPKKGLARTEYWSEAEVNKFLVFAEKTPRFPLYILAFNSGMRLGELFALKWDCVDFDNGIVTVRRNWCQKSRSLKESTKTNQVRSFKANKVLLKFLAELKLKTTGEMVLNPKEMGISNPAHASRAFRKDSEAAGVRPLRFHDIRHTFATQFVRNGGAIHAISGILGHSSTSMTDRYAHFGREHAAQVADIVSFAPPENSKILQLRGQKMDTAV